MTEWKKQRCVSVVRIRRQNLTPARTHTKWGIATKNIARAATSAAASARWTYNMPSIFDTHPVPWYSVGHHVFDDNDTPICTASTAALADEISNAGNIMYLEEMTGRRTVEMVN